jgi:hypothetical protein
MILPLTNFVSRNKKKKTKTNNLSIYIYIIFFFFNKNYLIIYFQQLFYYLYKIKKILAQMNGKIK